MTATCREACCNVAARLTVGELFERGFHRNRLEPLTIEGIARTDAEGNFARFTYCEFIAKLVPGFSIEIARQLSARDLVDGLPGVPELKHPRAVLAIAAFRAALAAASESSTIRRHPEVAERSEALEG